MSFIINPYSYPTGSSDPVDLFLAATGISDSTIESALRTLYSDLTTAGIWAKMSALYPFVGGDATKHSYNLKNTAQFQITWSGTVTHDANGVTGDGSTGYGNTGLVPSTHLTEDDVHMSLYSRTSAASGASVFDMGVLSSSSTRQMTMTVRNSSNNFTAFCDRTTTNNLSVSNTDGLGFYVASRRSSTDFEGYKNGTSVATNTGSDTASRPAIAFLVCARNVNTNGTAGGFSNRNMALVSIGSGLTDTEASDFNTAVQAFQTTLGRNV